MGYWAKRDKDKDEEFNVEEHLSLHKKWGFSLRASSVNVIFTEETLNRKLHFTCSAYCTIRCHQLNVFSGMFDIELEIPSNFAAYSTQQKNDEIIHK